VPVANIILWPGVDFTNLNSVVKFANEFSSRYGSLDLLINNAGTFQVYGGNATVNGIESVFQVNHLAPYLLTKLLVPALKRATSDDVRVICLE